MRYAQIRNMDISNGERVGISLFVQGCHFHCNNCFNSDTWNFDGGEKWSKQSKDRFLKLLSNPFIKRISVLGGEPLAKENVKEIQELVDEIRILYHEKSIWLYSGYVWEEIFNVTNPTDDVICRQSIIKNTDVFIDGRYVDELRNITLKWRGSSNQRVIDVKRTHQNGEIVLWTN